MTENEDVKEKNNKDIKIKDKSLNTLSSNQSEKNINNNNVNVNNIINDTNLLYNKLKSKFAIITKENNYLKSEMQNLKNKIINLEADKVCQKQNINELLNTQTNLLSLKRLIVEKEKTIEELKEQIISNHKKYNDELRYRESKFDYELIQSKVQYERAKYKIENYLKIENYSDALYKQVLEMEEIINNFNKIEESNMNKQKFEYMNKLNKFKKKMLDFLKDEINCKKSFREQIQLSNLVNNIHIQELIRDIEYLNNEVVELLEEKQELKYKIFCLVNDIQIYNKVINIVVLKNNHLQKRLFKKTISTPLINFEKFFNDKKNLKKNNENELINPQIKANKKLMKLSNSLTLLFDKNNKNNNINKNSNNTNISLDQYNSISYKNSPKENFINYKNDLKNKTNYLINKKPDLMQEKGKYKKYYEFYKGKYDSIKEQYTSIFKIYEEALEQLFNDLQKEKNDIYININKFRNYEFNYEEMTPEEKYFVLIKLIKHISPLVIKKDIENNIFNEQLLNVKEKYAVMNNSGKSLNFSTKQNSLDIPLKFNKRKKNNTELCKSESNGIKLIDKKHFKLCRFLKNSKNKKKIFLELKNYLKRVPTIHLENIPINDFYNGPYSSI